MAARQEQAPTQTLDRNFSSLLFLTEKPYSPSVPPSHELAPRSAYAVFNDVRDFLLSCQQKRGRMKDIEMGYAQESYELIRNRIDWQLFDVTIFDPQDPEKSVVFEGCALKGFVMKSTEYTDGNGKHYKNPDAWFATFEVERSKRYNKEKIEADFLLDRITAREPHLPLTLKSDSV